MTCPPIKLILLPTLIGLCQGVEADPSPVVATRNTAEIHRFQTKYQHDDKLTSPHWLISTEKHTFSLLR
jgi:hypothetical protein